MINNMNQIFQPVQEEDNIIDQIYPNPDNMTYEQLLELQEKIGYVNKGLSTEEIKRIPVISFSKTNTKSKNHSSECTKCQFDYKEGEKLNQLNCKHTYHTHCVEEWLQNNKSCPICKEEVKI
jgi:hypothetical protein